MCCPDDDDDDDDVKEVDATNDQQPWNVLDANLLYTNTHSSKTQWWKRWDMVVQVGINHTQSAPTLRHILPDKKSFDDDDDDDDDDHHHHHHHHEEKEEEEEDVMKEMRLCTPWISTPFDPPPTPKRLILSLNTPPPF